MRIAQAAFFPPLLLGCHRALCWHGCQAYVEALNSYASARAGGELEIWLQAVPAHPGVALREAAVLPAVPPCHAVPPAVRPGCPDLRAQGRAVWHVTVAFFLFFNRAGGDLIALNSEIIIQALHRRRWHARERKKKKSLSANEVDSLTPGAGWWMISELGRACSLKSYWKCGVKVIKMVSFKYLSYVTWVLVEHLAFSSIIFSQDRRRTFSLLSFDRKLKASPVKRGLNPNPCLLAAWEGHCCRIARLCVLAANEIVIAHVTSGEKIFLLSVWRAARAPGKSRERQILNDMH